MTNFDFLFILLLSNPHSIDNIPSDASVVIIKQKRDIKRNLPLGRKRSVRASVREIKLVERASGVREIAFGDKFRDKS